MTDIEYELTYLAKLIPEQIKAVKPKTITDYYLPEENCIHPKLRLRANNGIYEITKKEPINSNDSSEQYEHTIALTKQEYNDLTKNLKRVVVKDRYSVVINGYQADVDVFKGELKGLVLIDFEFKSPKEKSNFTPPDVCLADVTQEAFIAGGMLAGKTYNNITNYLNKYNYKKL
jgi:CYTH domain-containing protein